MSEKENDLGLYNVPELPPTPGDFSPTKHGENSEDTEELELISDNDLFNVFFSVLTATNTRISRCKSDLEETPSNKEMKVDGDKEVEEDVEELTLSQKLMGECTKIGELAGQWTDSYENDPSEASRAMLELILHSSGYTQPLSVQQSLELDQLDPETFSEWISGADVDPPILDDLYIKNLLKFLLLTIVDDVCLDDNLILKRIRTLLEVMSKSTWVSARYTSLMIGSAIVSQHLGYYAKLNTELDGISVPGNKTVIEERMTLVKASFSDFMNFVELRIRDASLAIRRIAFRIFCGWIGEPLLMTHHYLRYIYWALFEESPTMRGLAVMTCAILYKSNYVLTNLKTFVKMTLPYILIRTQDVNSLVADAAFETASDVYRFPKELVQDLTMEPISRLVYGADPDKAARASELLHKRLKSGVSITNLLFILRTIKTAEDSLKEVRENLDLDSIYSVLAAKLFRHSHEELTDWNAWFSLLRDRYFDQSNQRQELACTLLLEVLKLASSYAYEHFSIEIDFPPVPSVDEKQVTKEKSYINVKEGFKIKCRNHLLRLASSEDLEDFLVTLWDKYMTNKKCLAKLVAIPQYFNGQIDNLNVNAISRALAYIRNFMYDSATLHAVHHSMACLYHRMLGSEKCKPLTRNVEHLFFKDVIGKLLKSCEVLLAKQPLSPGEELQDMRVVKHTLFLTKFFDVSKTPLLNEVPQALKLGATEGSAKIVCPTAMMCLYILQWQVKDLVEGKFTGEVLTARVIQIQSLSRSLVSQLQSLMSAENSLVRSTVYSVLCRVYAMLCPSNAFTRNYPQVHLPPPSLEIKEWLNYGLKCQVPQENVPEDENQFKLSSEALRMFCSLLEAQVLNISYISSILYCFQFYRHPKNYNNILEGTVRLLVKSTSFSREVAESLMWMQENSNDNVEEISKGLCTVALAKLQLEKSPAKCLEVLHLGLSKVRNQRDLCILPILAPFVRLLHKKDATRLYKSAKNMFRQYLDSGNVKAFLAAFERRR